MSIVVGGLNDFNQILQKNNSHSITIPINQNFTFPDISYSVCYQHSVAVGQNNTPYAVGNNNQNQIYALGCPARKRWYEFHITDNNKNIYQVQSAVCGVNYTLYLLKVNNPNYSPLAVVFGKYNNGFPTFLKTNGKKIVGIFGGCYHSAAIDEEGIIHIITEQNVKAIQSTIITRLPESEIPIFAAFQSEMIVVLSKSGNVYQYNLLTNFSGLFTPVSELIGVPCISISGSANHCLAVSIDGQVFGRGSNENRQIAGKMKYEYFTHIKALNSQKIVAAYAGYSHSLFQNIDGRLFAVGSNVNGECLMASGIKDTTINTPMPTIVLSGCRHCIVGCYLTVAFVDQNPPSCSPNLTLQTKICYRMMSGINNDSEREEAINNLNNQIQKKNVKIKAQTTILNELKSQLQNEQKKHKKEVIQLKKLNESEMNKLKKMYEKAISENKKLKKQIEMYKEKLNNDGDEQYEYNDDDEKVVDNKYSNRINKFIKNEFKKDNEDDQYEYNEEEFITNKNSTNKNKPNKVIQKKYKKENDEKFVTNKKSENKQNKVDQKIHKNDNEDDQYEYNEDEDEEKFVSNKPNEIDHELHKDDDDFDFHVKKQTKTNLNKKKSEKEADKAVSIKEIDDDHFEKNFDDDYDDNENDKNVDDDDDYDDNINDKNDEDEEFNKKNNSDDD